MMPIPVEVWQWPLLGVVLVVMGYLLWANREQRKEAKEERASTANFLQELVASNDEERKANTAQLVDLVERTTQAQEEHAAAVATIAETLAGALDKHDRETRERLEQLTAEVKAANVTRSGGT